MRIGRLRARFRWTSVEPEYYNDYASFKAFGGKAEARIPPFDGKAFLNWDWNWQNDGTWYGRSVNGLVPTASVDYTSVLGDIWGEWRKKRKTNKKDWCLLTLFSEHCDNIIVNYTLNLEGAWIEWGGGEVLHITVLKTTRVKMKLKAETREVLLSPGATILLSPITFMQKLGENISVRKRGRRLPTQVRKIFASAKTPQELAARLELEPVRLQEELEDKGELMRRLVDY